MLPLTMSSYAASHGSVLKSPHRIVMLLPVCFRLNSRMATKQQNALKEAENLFFF